MSDIITTVSKSCKTNNVYDVVIYDREGIYQGTKRFNDLSVYQRYLTHIVKDENCTLSTEYTFTNENRMIVVFKQ